MNVTKLIILTVLLLGAIGLSLQKDSYEYRLSSKATEPTHEHLQEIILKTSNRLQELSSMDAMAWVSREDGTGYDSVQYLRYKLRRKLDSAIKKLELISDCKYGQCRAITKSTKKRCLKCVSKKGDTYCSSHK